VKSRTASASRRERSSRSCCPQVTGPQPYSAGHQAFFRDTVPAAHAHTPAPDGADAAGGTTPRSSAGDPPFRSVGHSRSGSVAKPVTEPDPVLASWSPGGRWSAKRSAPIAAGGSAAVVRGSVAVAQGKTALVDPAGAQSALSLVTSTAAPRFGAALLASSPARSRSTPSATTMLTADPDTASRRRVAPTTGY